MGKSRAAMKARLGPPIRVARRAVRLTQAELGQRVGLTEQAVYRWERNASRPNPRLQRALVLVIRAIDPAVGDQLAAAFGGDIAASVRQTTAATGSAPATQSASSAPASDDPAASALGLAVFRAADELDLPSRRVRSAVARLLRRLGNAGYTLEHAAAEAEAWVKREA